jgi:deoxyribonuclease V
MASGFDFYAALRELLEQIPEKWVSTPRDIARALGDPAADRAITEALQRKELRSFATRVTETPKPQEKTFADFESDEPLKRLAELQRIMAKQIIPVDDQVSIRSVAGADASYSMDTAYAACVVMDEKMNISETRSAITATRFPYIPGYLAFREAAAILSVVRKTSGFDVLMVNGHGAAHPRGCGLAAFVGLELDAPTVGVARGRLFGDVGAEQDGWAPITHEGVLIGAELREMGRHPIYVSVGHRVSLESSVGIVRDLRTEGSLPEPLRVAHIRAEEERKTRTQSA